MFCIFLVLVTSSEIFVSIKPFMSLLHAVISYCYIPNECVYQMGWNGYKMFINTILKVANR
jgi:hypothetical protein